MTLFRGTYRSETTRLRDYDYASSGWYHVVMCTKDRACVFGTVEDGALKLSKAGVVAHRAWADTLDRYERAVPDAFVVMPNHVHAIVGILPQPHDVSHDDDVETRRGASLRARRKFGPLRKHSLSSIVNHYKGRVTKRIRRRKMLPAFAWQPRFWDRVIRDDRELAATRRYIANNPARWTEDRLNR